MPVTTSRSRRASAAVVAVATLASVSAAVLGPPNAGAASTSARLGTNISGLADWSTEMPFVNQFKSTRDWISGDADTWENSLPIDVDDQGWVRSLQPGQLVRAVLVTEVPQLRGGAWDFVYSGSGDIDFSVPTTEVGPGHLTIDVQPGDTVFLTINSIDAANPIRDIEFTAPGGTCDADRMTYAASAAACSGKGGYLPFIGNTDEIMFSPDFLARTRPYEAIRFMDWMGTNNSTQQSWTNRPEVDDARWFSGGVPVEVMVRLANFFDVHPWFTMPHLADDAYVRNFATIVRDSLDPGLVAYVEWSNEVWNGQFGQNTWAGDQGLALGLADVHWEAAWLFYAKRSTEVHKLWAEVFGGRDRLHMVTASQAASSYVSEQILGFQDTAAWTDSLAIAPYFGEVPNDEGRGGELRSTSVDAYFGEIESRFLPEAIGYMTASKAAADRFGVRLTAYEGGQHFTLGFALVDDPTINKLFDDINRDPRMGDVYRRYLDAWSATGGDVFMHFVNVGGWSKWGRWGALESVLQTSSPKFDALMAYLAGTPTPPTTTTTTAPPTTAPPTTTAPPVGSALVTESFDLAAGPVHGSSGWIVQNGPDLGGGYAVVDGSLDVAGLATSGGHLTGGDSWLTSGRALGSSPDDADGTRFAAVVLRKDTGDSETVSATFHGVPITWFSQEPTVSIGALGDAATWSIGVGDRTASSGVPVVLGQPTLLVLAVDADGTARLWVDPLDALGRTAPAPSATLEGVTGSMASVAVYLGGANGGAADEIRVGTSFAAVTPVHSGGSGS
jgi:hypothetical protein